MDIKEKAVVLFSGGQDSTTCLGWALKKYAFVEAISFQYGQRHIVELAQARYICQVFDVSLTTHELPSLSLLGDSALTAGGNVAASHSRYKALPASFVPNRNALFLTIAHAFAQKVQATTLVLGMCETDYFGYPDCREVFINNLIEVLNLGSTSHIKVITPLMHLDKAATFKLAEDCGILSIVLEESLTCYEGAIKISNNWGKGCGNCPACKLRKAGYEKYLIEYK